MADAARPLRPPYRLHEKYCFFLPLISLLLLLLLQVVGVCLFDIMIFVAFIQKINKTNLSTECFVFPLQKFH